MSERMEPLVAPRYMDVATCAVYIGRTTKAIQRLCERGEIPHAVIGHKRQFDKVKIDAWVERHARRGKLLT